jgi:hypothetical protein
VTVTSFSLSTLQGRYSQHHTTIFSGQGHNRLAKIDVTGLRESGFGRQRLIFCPQQDFNPELRRVINKINATARSIARGKVNYCPRVLLKRIVTGIQQIDTSVRCIAALEISIPKRA